MEKTQKRSLRKMTNFNAFLDSDSQNRFVPDLAFETRTETVVKIWTKSNKRKKMEFN